MASAASAKTPTSDGDKSLARPFVGSQSLSGRDFEVRQSRMR